MENQLLFSMRWCSLILLFLALSSKADDSSSSLYSTIYYGDSDVNVGEPFSITCIVSISDPIRWLKDGESLSKHNLRHGKDDHAFNITEHGIEAANIIGNYDNKEHMLKSFEIRFPLVLSCNVTTPGVSELKWKKNGTDVDKVDSLKGRYKIIDAEKKFIIEKTDAADAGLYQCVSESLNDEAKFNVYANVVVRVPSNTGVVEGEKLTIHCLVVGTEPSLSWTVGNKTLTKSEDRFILKEDDNGVQNALFSIENISLEDRGDYKCTARNPASELGTAEAASDTSYVRVKGKLAALWPFLGICAEVFVLCAIILIYEKRRNKTELDESDTDPNTEQEKLKPQRN